jgi:hypothetical protein
MLMLNFSLIPVFNTTKSNHRTWYYDLPDRIIVRSFAGGWNFTIFKKTGATSLALESLNTHLTYGSWGNVLFEFGIGNSFLAPPIFKTEVTYVDNIDGVIVILSRATNVPFNYSILWIFWRDKPYFYVEFNALFDGNVRVEGEAWEVCIFNRLAQEFAALDYYGRIVYNSTVILLPDHNVMERNGTFPWIAAYNKHNGATVASILLYAYPPAPVAYNHPNGAEVQYVVMPYLTAGRPYGAIHIKLIIYPYITNENPKWIKAYKLSQQLFTSFYIDEPYSFQKWSQVTWFSQKGYQHFLAINSQGKINVMYTYVLAALLHTTGILSSAITRSDYAPIFSSAILGMLVNASGTYRIDLRASPDLRYGEGYGPNAVGWVAGTTQGLKVNLTISTSNDAGRFLITITWDTTKKSLIKQLYIPFAIKGSCSKQVLNSTFIDYYCIDPWQGYLGVLIGVVNLKGDVNATFDIKNNIIYVVKNERDVMYPENVLWKLELLIWPHYGKLNSAKDIITLSVQKKVLVAKNHLLGYPNLSIAFNVMPMYIQILHNSTILGFSSLSDNIIVKGIQCSTNGTLHTCYPETKMLKLKMISPIRFICIINASVPLWFVTDTKIDACSYTNNTLMMKFRANPDAKVLIFGTIFGAPLNITINNESITYVQSLDLILNKSINGYVYIDNNIYILYSVQKEENTLYLVFRGEERKLLYTEETKTSPPHTCTIITPPTTATTTMMKETVTQTFKTTVTETVQKTAILATTFTTIVTATIIVTTSMANRITVLIVLQFIVIGILLIIVARHYLKKANKK